jgi:hypothetical protein
MEPWDDEYTERFVQMTSIFAGYEIDRDRAQYVADKLQSVTGLPHVVKQVDLWWTVAPVEEANNSTDCACNGDCDGSCPAAEAMFQAQAEWDS